MGTPHIEHSQFIRSVPCRAELVSSTWNLAEHVRLHSLVSTYRTAYGFVCSWCERGFDAFLRNINIFSTSALPILHQLSHLRRLLSGNRVDHPLLHTSTVVQTLRDTMAVLLAPYNTAMQLGQGRPAAFCMPSQLTLLTFRRVQFLHAGVMCRSSSHSRGQLQCYAPE
jgi:hypothetical protein